MQRFQYLFLASFLFAITVLPVSAQSTWVEKDLGTVGGLKGIVQVDGRYTAVGNTGNILGSTDTGETWSVVDQNTSAYWQDVAALDKKLWVIGEGGTMRLSTDGGSTWSNVNLGVAENLYDVDMVSGYGYLVGAGGRIMAYNSSANQWLSVASPTTRALYRVQDVGGGKLWVVGEQGYLYYGFDAGSSWETKGRIDDDDLYGVWFKSSTTGYAVGRNGSIRMTTDGSVSWSDVSVDGIDSQNLYDIRMNGDEMIIVGDNVLAYSPDAGATWEVKDYSEENYTFYNAYFSDDGIWVVGTQDDVKSVILLFPTGNEENIVDEGTTGTSDEEIVDGEPAQIIEAEPGSLIKLVCLGGEDSNDPCHAVYYYANDGTRHAFPNERIFFTWFDNFDDVINVSEDFMSNLTLGANVTYHPGTRMVKFLSVPTVYAVEARGVLRAIASEDVASNLYGEDWNQQIDDISDAFYGNYSFGETINDASDYDSQDVEASIQSLDDNF